MFARVSDTDFSQQSLYDELVAGCPASPGAIVTFTGLVRDFNDNGKIDGLSLEHYSPMTERAMQLLAEQAITRFALENAGVVHRVGRLSNFSQIVWVGCAASHRASAFDAACYIMDTLKTAVPLWKKEFQNGTGHWVKAKASDADASLAWMKDNDR